MLGQFLQSNLALVVCGSVAAVTAGIALIWSKYPVRWLLVIATIVLIFFVVTMQVPELDPQLPSLFRDFFKVWVAVLGLISIYTLTHLGAMVVRHYIRSGEGATTTEGKYPEIDSAWQEILIKLSQARIDIASQKLYVLLAPTEALAASVVEAAGLQFFANAPASPESPIHCHAVSDALLVSVSGASALGRQDAEGKARLEHLCRLIAVQTPERPILRGIALLLPFEWATSPDALKQVSAVREDIQTITTSFQVRCPTLSVFCLRESMPGFNEFAARMPANLRQSRCGFTVPVSLGFGDSILKRGMLWMIQWFESWSLNLMVQEIRNKDGNNRLTDMNVAFRRNRKNLVSLLESGLTMHQQADPVLFRGCYFVACGPEANKHAFAAGLLRGAKGRLLADHPLASWSTGAERRDRFYRKLALGLAIATAIITVPIWIFAINARLAEDGASWIGFAVLGLLAVVWAVVLLATRTRKKAPATSS